MQLAGVTVAAQAFSVGPNIPKGQTECGKKRYPKYNQHHLCNHPLHLFLPFYPINNDTIKHAVSFLMQSQKYTTGIMKIPKKER